MKTLFLAATLCSCTIVAAAQNAPQSTLDAVPGLVETQNPGFEGDYKPASSSSDAPNQKAVIKGQIAEGWGDNSNWADVDVEYARDTDNPHRGQTSQRVRVNRVASGAVQFVQNVPFKKGRIHVWRLWMRGRPGSSVTLMMRRTGAPYTEYASQTASLAAEWQEFRVFGVIPEDADGLLMVRATSPMTFWIDDSTLQDLTSASSDAPPQAGNLLTGGGSFEAGMPFGWSVRYEGDQKFRPLDPRPGIDNTTAATGKQSLRCPMPIGSNLRIASPLLHPNFGREHTLSFWAKADVANTPLEVNIEKAFGGSIALSSQWERYTVTQKMPFLPYTMLRFQAPETKIGNTIWLDGVQFEEKSASSDAVTAELGTLARVPKPLTRVPPHYRASEPVELSLQMSQPGHVVLDGEAATVRVTAAGISIPIGARLQLSAVDLNGQNSVLPGVALPAAPKVTIGFDVPPRIQSVGASFSLPAMNNRRGTWKLRAQVVDRAGKVLSAPYEMIWARLPRPKNIDPKQSYFGLHLPLAQNFFDIARRLGVRRTRLHDTSMVGKWAVTEPEKDQFHFFDEGIDRARKSGIEVLGMLDGAPAWTTTKPREGGYWGIWNIPDQPGAVDRWENYVRRVVGHFKGRIDQWEIWNEPWGAWWISSENPNATPQLYAELSRRAHTAAHEVNPGVQILGIDTYPGNTWTELVLPHAGPKYFEGFSFHEYNDALFGGPQAIPFLRRTEFTQTQSKYGQAKPLWNTEGGLFGVGSWLAPETGGMPVAQQPSYIVRYDVTMMAAGVRAFWLYAMHTDPILGGIETATSEYDRSVKPILSARAVLASMVDGLGAPVRSEPTQGVDFYTYPGQRVGVAWSYDGEVHSLRVPRGLKVLDVWGNAMPKSATVAVGVEPIYFVR